MTEINIVLQGFTAKEKEFLERILKILSLGDVAVNLVDMHGETRPNCYLINHDKDNNWQYFLRKLKERNVHSLVYLVANEAVPNMSCLLRPITVHKIKEMIQEVVEKQYSYIPGLVIDDDQTQVTTKATNKGDNKTFRRQALVVDDSQAVLTAMTQALEIQQIGVTAENQPEQALLRTQYSSFDIIFLDVMMPGLSGYDLAKEIRKKDKITPIVMLTSKNSPVDRMRASLVGSNFFLNKPVTSQELLEVLDKFKLAKARY